MVFICFFDHFPKWHRKFGGIQRYTSLLPATVWVAARCQNCELTEWSKWGECSSSCGEGQQVSNRKVRCLDRWSQQETWIFFGENIIIELPSWKYLEILCWYWGLLSMILEFFGSGAIFKAIFKMKSTCPPVNSGCSSTMFHISKLVNWCVSGFQNRYRCFQFIAVDLLLQWLKRAAPHVSSTSWVSSGSLTWLWTIAHFTDDMYIYI